MTTTHPQSEAEEKKKTDESSQLEVLRFGDPHHKAQYQGFVENHFFEGQVIDWLILERIGLTNEV